MYVFEKNDYNTQIHKSFNQFMTKIMFKKSEPLVFILFHSIRNRAIESSSKAHTVEPLPNNSVDSQGYKGEQQLFNVFHEIVAKNKQNISIQCCAFRKKKIEIIKFKKLILNDVQRSYT